MVRDRQLLIRLEHETRESLKERVKDYDSRRDVGTVLYEIVSRIADGSLPLSVALGEDSAVPKQGVIEGILSRLTALESKLNDSDVIAVSNDDAEPVNYFPDVVEDEAAPVAEIVGKPEQEPIAAPLEPEPVRENPLGLVSGEVYKQAWLAKEMGIKHSNYLKRRYSEGLQPRSKDKANPLVETYARRLVEVEKEGNQVMFRFLG